LNFFHVLIGHLYFSFNICLLNLFAHLLIELLVLLEFNSCIHSIFWILIIYLMNSWQRLSPSCMLPLDSGNCCYLCCSEAFWFDAILSIRDLIS
jgi:hypothetical protein